MFSAVIGHAAKYSHVHVAARVSSYIRAPCYSFFLPSFFTLRLRFPSFLELAPLSVSYVRNGRRQKSNGKGSHGSSRMDKEDTSHGEGRGREEIERKRD